MFKIAERSVLLSRIVLTFVFLLILALFLPLLKTMFLISFLCVITALLFYLFFFFYYIPRFRTGYEISISKAVTIKRGVLKKQVVFIPCSGLLYFERITDPLQQLFSLETIRIRIIKGRITIPFLEISTAEKMIGLLEEIQCTGRIQS